MAQKIGVFLFASFGLINGSMMNSHNAHSGHNDNSHGHDHHSHSYGHSIFKPIAHKVVKVQTVVVAPKAEVKSVFEQDHNIDVITLPLVGGISPKEFPHDHNSKHKDHVHEWNYKTHQWEHEHEDAKLPAHAHGKIAHSKKRRSHSHSRSRSHSDSH